LCDARWLALVERIRGELGIARHVVLLRSGERAMPMTWGAWPGRPARVLLPAAVERWSAERVRAVLLHELAHVKRHDCLTQLVAQLACAVHWFNPLIWVAGHRMLIERERACDDLALSAGQRPSRYAQHLLDIAHRSRAPMLAAAAGVAMARRSGMERRLLAVLDETRSRRALSRSAITFSAAVVMAVVAPVAMVSAQSQTRSWSGTMSREALKQRVIAARRNATKQFHHLYIESTMLHYKKNKAGRWAKTPQRTHIRSWYEALGRGRFRIDYDPRMVQWYHGPKPYSKERFTVVYDGRHLRKIENVYDKKSKTYSSRVDATYQGVPKGYKDAYWPLQNGMNVLPQSPTLADPDLDITRVLGHPVAKRETRRIERVKRAGEKLIRAVDIHRAAPPSNHEMRWTFILNAEKGYMIQRIVMKLPGKKAYDRYHVTKVEASGGRCMVSDGMDASTRRRQACAQNTARGLLRSGAEQDDFQRP